MVGSAQVHLVRVAEIMLAVLSVSASSLLLPTRLPCRAGIRPALVTRHAPLLASGDDPDAMDPNCAHVKKPDNAPATHR